MKIFFIFLSSLIVFFIVIFNSTPASAINCMCDCHFSPGSCGYSGNITTDVESCSYDAVSAYACENSGCAGKQSASSCYF